MIIPQRSTFEIQDKLFVFVVGSDGKIFQKPITSVRRIPNYFVIEPELNPTTAIIYEGASNLKHGDKVKIRLQNSTSTTTLEKPKDSEKLKGRKWNNDLRSQLKVA